MSADLRCSDGSEAADEQLAGSAPAARAWVALEQNGPWGAKAFTQSHLPADVGRVLEETAAHHGVRPALIRRPGRHADQPHSRQPRRVLVGHSVPGRTWLLEADVDGPDRLLELDWAAVAAGSLDDVRRTLPGASASDRPHLLVCTNGTRDLCCAAKGRPLALGLADRHPGQVWEVTHTSGHRFAPTAVLLPAGTLHGRLDLEAAEGLLAAAARGETVLAGHRGRSVWEPAGQVAELFVRELVGETGLDALTVHMPSAPDPHRWLCRVEHGDGRGWMVEVTSEPTGSDRAESCGKGLTSLRRWRCRIADQVAEPPGWPVR